MQKQTNKQHITNETFYPQNARQNRKQKQNKKQRQNHSHTEIHAKHTNLTNTHTI